MEACMDEDGMVRSAAHGAHAEFIISGGVGPGPNWIADCTCFHFAFIDGINFSFPTS